MATREEYLVTMESIGLRETAALRLAEPGAGGSSTDESRVTALENSIAALERRGRLSEAAPMLHSDVKSRLSKAVIDSHPDEYASYVDHTGDGASGDVIYQVRGETRSAPYAISKPDGVASTRVDTGKAKKVVGSTNYTTTEADRLRESTSLAHAMGLRGKAARTHHGGRQIGF